LFRELRPASSENRARGAAFLESQQARGGTILGPAITAAYRYRDPDRPLNVVILSDGLTEQRDRAELLALIRSRPSNARVFCIGVGNDVDKPLLEQLAADAGGLSAFVSREDNFSRTAEAFRRKLLRPVGTNVQMTIDGVDVYDLEPKDVSNLYHGTPVRAYGRYRKGGEARITVRADVDGADLSQAATITFPTKESGNPEIERMWALHRMQRLLKEADRTGSRDTVIGEIVRLGEAYSIVSEYTSFLVLENDAEYQRWKLDRHNVLRTARDRRQQRDLDAQLAALRQAVPEGLGTASDLARNSQPVAPGVQPALTQPGARPTSGGGASSGGGALDPVSGGLALGLAGLALYRRRQQRRGER
jgi:Ca-activated chloride channel family protein